MATNPPLQTSPADPNPEGATLASQGEPTTLVVAAGTVVPPGAGSPTLAWANMQGSWPTPPLSPPAPPAMVGPGVIPWRMYLRNLAVRPFQTDPPPCPVVVSYYGYPPNGLTY